MTDLRSIIEALLNGNTPAEDAFDPLLAELSISSDLEIAKKQGMELGEIVQGCEQRLDVLGAMALLVTDDPALPWERAGLLDELGRHGEAAHEFLEAARRSDNLVGTGEAVVPDEELWAETARYLAAKALVAAGAPVSAAVVAQRVETAEDRLELQGLIRAHAED